MMTARAITRVKPTAKDASRIRINRSVSVIVMSLSFPFGDG